MPDIEIPAEIVCDNTDFSLKITGILPENTHCSLKTEYMA